MAVRTTAGMEAKAMLKLKGCVRCGGDLNADGQDWQCLQCGHYYYDGLGEGSADAWLDPARALGSSQVAGAKWRPGPAVIDLAERKPKTPKVAASRSARRGRPATVARNR